MTPSTPICFEIFCRNKVCNQIGSIAQELSYERLLSSLIEACQKFTFSLRYLYDPADNQKLRYFILINPFSQVDNHETLERIEGIIKGSLSRFYNLTRQSEVFQCSNWVSSISELFKYGELVEEPEFIGYLPHFFYTKLIDDEFSILELLEAARCEKLILEFSLEAYDSKDEKDYYERAIKDLVNRLDNHPSRSNFMKNALYVYKDYQNHYFGNQLFRYAIKALGCSSVDTSAILQSLTGLFGKANTRHQNNSISIYSPSDSAFNVSLEATQKVRVYQYAKWGGWGTEIGKKLEIKSIKETVKSGGLLAAWDDGSLDPPKPFLTFEESLELFRYRNLSLPQPGQSEVNSEANGLVLGGSSAIEKFYKDRIPKVEHLKPLHHITTFQEVAGFVQFFSPSVSTQQRNFPVMSAEEIFNEYRHLITRDTYIVGLDDAKNPIVSNWAEIPHRLIAGLPGAGKTNFLNWIVFQFLYVNPRRKVYIADFGGVDFQHLDRLNLNIKIVDTPEDCRDLVENIHHEEYEKRLDLMKRNSVSDLKLLQKEGVDIDRTLWIIDEAADIADSSIKLKESIERRLKEYARKGRKYGIHILYCTQRPTTEVISKQVTDHCEEKTIFRVTSDASQRILDDTIAGNIPKDSRGRAWLDGYAGRMFVNVPKMKKPEGSTIPIADTLWHHFLPH